MTKLFLTEQDAYEAWKSEAFDTSKVEHRPNDNAAKSESLFNDETRRMRLEQQKTTAFFAGGNMAIDDSKHGFENAKVSLAGLGQHGMFAGKKRASADPALNVNVEPNKTKKI